METLQLKLSSAGIDAPEEALLDLQNWLQDAGIHVELEQEPPAEGELGGKATAVLLVFSLATEFTHLPPSVEEGLQQIHEWQQQNQGVQVVLHPTAHQHQEEIQEAIRREQWHIELREPKIPPRSPEKKL